MLRLILVGIISILSGIICQAERLSLLQTGILNEENPVNRYWILYNVHHQAMQTGDEVDYSNVDSLSIEIPKNAVSIPLNRSCDFKGLKLYVTNKSKNIELFTLKNQPVPLTLTPAQIDASAFIDIPELASGMKMICIRDTVPWVTERVGYGYPVYRKDILLIIDGKPVNKCIRPYNDGVSYPECTYVELLDSKCVFSNITIKRSTDSMYKTYCFTVSYQNDIIFDNIKIYTPESNLYGDRAITVNNSTNVVFREVTIDGSYSQINKYGYGIYLDNVWNSEFNSLKGNANWGIFGNNNINVAKITDSDINRFDIHCYGKDISASNTIFRDLYNQFSSFYGSLTFTKCEFINFIPVLIENSYQTYTEFDIIIKKCRLFTENTTPMIVKMGKSSNSNKRVSLSGLYWPNVNINGLQIVGNYSSQTLYIYTTTRKPPIILDNNLKVKISGLTKKTPFNIKLCDKQIKSKEEVSIIVKKSDIKDL